MNEKRSGGVKLLGVLAGLALVACSSSNVKNPLESLKRQLAPYDEYTVTLEDMRQTGNFYKGYEHQYKAVFGKKQPGSQEVTFKEASFGWRKVPQRLYQKLQPYLGMVVLSKNAAGKVEEAFYPPGYQHVGNSRYGSWRQDSGGRSFWVFYGQYRMLSDVFGFGGRPVYRGDWDNYRTSRTSRRPYFGPGGNTYGTRGGFTKTTHKSFFERQQVRQASRQRSFSNRVNSRTSRSGMSGSRSRSSGRGGK